MVEIQLRVALLLVFHPLVDFLLRTELLWIVFVGFSPLGDPVGMDVIVVVAFAIFVGKRQDVHVLVYIPRARKRQQIKQR